MSVLLVAAGAALGAPLRYLASRRFDGAWPLGTWLVNVAGSALIGWFAGLGLAGASWAFWASGFCGGLTSFSAVAVHTAAARGARGWAYAVATVLAAALACTAGLELAGA